MADMSALMGGVVEGLLFGSAWYFGILIFFILAIALLKMWKYSGAILIPLLLVLENEYYQRETGSGDMIWPMVCIGFLILSIAVYTVMGAKKGD